MVQGQMRGWKQIWYELGWLIKKRWNDHRAQTSLIGLALVIAIGLLITYKIISWLTGTHNVTASVDHKTWIREISIQQYQWTNETSMFNCPSGSRNCTSAIVVTGHNYSYTYQTNYAGRSCTGSGSSQICTNTYTTSTQTQTQTLYGTEYYYQIQEWQDERSVNSHGTVPANSLYALANDEGTTPKSPTYTLVNNGNGPERAQPEHDTYTVYFKDLKDNHFYNVTMQLESWNSVQIGSGYTLQVDVVGQIRHYKLN